MVVLSIQCPPKTKWTDYEIKDFVPNLVFIYEKFVHLVFIEE